MTNIETEVIRQLLQRINGSWLSGGSDQIRSVMNPRFHPDMMIKGAKGETLAKGREACIQSYLAFASSAQIVKCTLSEPAIDVIGGIAIASYSWSMTYRMKGVESSESGSDLFVFSRQPQGWRAVWRMLLPTQPEN